VVGSAWTVIVADGASASPAPICVDGIVSESPGAAGREVAPAAAGRVAAAASRSRRLLSEPLL